MGYKTGEKKHEIKQNDVITIGTPDRNAPLFLTDRSDDSCPTQA